MVTIDLIECLWYYWNHHRKALVNGRDIESWCHAPRDRNNKPMPLVHLDQRRYEAFYASLDAQQSDAIVRWKKGPHDNSPVSLSLSQQSCAPAYQAAQIAAQADWIEGHVPPKQRK
ncbi:hypothetical protein WME98_27590 [Sorangium sp. So ce296]|uniref:hypothetical protein n=1 Tax=Sorangium sp. So ce296 TaxID=3133296 RepID=UPI003F5E9799